MFSGNPLEWTRTEYAIAALSAIILWRIYLRLKRKPAPKGPACMRCGTYAGVSQCTYCKTYYCQTHIFRQSHKCQGWMTDRSPLGGLQGAPKK